MFDLLIIGAGPAGISAAFEAERAGLDYVVIEKGLIGNTMYHYPVGVTGFSTASGVDSNGGDLKPVRGERTGGTAVWGGNRMGMGGRVLGGGRQGKRNVLPNSKILNPQVWGGYQGQASDIEIHARETISLKRKLEEIISKHTKQDMEKVRSDMDRDYFMTSEEAVEYGIIDRVITHR